jgi:hypothetical protein
MEFSIKANASSSDVQIALSTLIVAGWAGRDSHAVEHHIKELEAIGVAPPSTYPLFYRVSAHQLTQSDDIQVVGENTAGEVEPFLFVDDGELFVSVGSDHTDRTLETASVALSKQICTKPVARVAWPFSEVREHWDELELTSWIVDENGEETLYQQGKTSFLKRPEQLLETYLDGSKLRDGLCMFGGTVPVIGTIRAAAGMRFEIADHRLGRRIEHRYSVTTLPEVA